MLNFSANKTSVKVIKESYFRDIYSDGNGKWYGKSLEEFDELKNIDNKYYCQNYFDITLSKYGAKCGPSLRFWENKEWNDEIDSHVWFQWHFR